MSENKKPLLIIPNNTYVSFATLGGIVGAVLFFSTLYSDLAYTKKLAESDHEIAQQERKEDAEFQLEVLQRLSTIEAKVNDGSQPTASISGIQENLTRKQ